MSDVLPFLLIFAFTTVGTPGPNNLMLLASGANFGFQRTVPHMLGIGLGHVFQIFAIGILLIGIFEQFPWLERTMQAAAVAYMLYLAWKIANAAPPSDAPSKARPLTFLQAAAFQWVNPKAWAMATSAISIYAPDRSLAAVLLVCAVFLFASCFSTTGWTVIGVQVKRFLATRTRLRAFNWTMAALLIGSLYPILQMNG